MSNSKDREILLKAFELLNEYVEQNNQDDCTVLNFQSPDSIRDQFDFSISNDGISYNKLFKVIEQYLSLSVRTGNKQFYNQLYGGFNIPAFLGEIFTAITNGSMYTYECAPIATLMEIELIRKMNKMAGFVDGEGVMTNGGSNANLMGMMCARNKMFPEIRKTGIQNGGTLKLFVSDQAHFSIERAASIIGIGSNNVVHIQSDENGAMIPEALDIAIQESISKGEKPFFIGATAGTTVVGGFDPIKSIASIAKKYRIWLHVDGSWGGSVLLSSKYKHMITGLESADSFAWNPHKLMNIPLICSVLLLREKGTLRKILSADNSNYIFHDHDYDQYDLGQVSTQCGRRVDSLKLFLAWKYFGDKGYEMRINHLFELKKYTLEKINASNRLEIVGPVPFLNICFRYLPEVDVDIDEFNLKIRQKLNKSGLSMVNYAYLKEKLVIRLVLVNPEVNYKDIDQLFDNITSVVNEISQ